MNAIVVLTRVPNRESLAFYSGFARLGYEVFVVIDDNGFKPNIGDDQVGYAQITVIQIDDSECRKQGFVRLNDRIKKKSGCSAWEKALYYFCRLNTLHENVWFIEDDVFVPSHEAILKVDRKYLAIDILSAENEVNESGERGEWFWWQFVPRSLPPPWAKSMVCAVRLSRRVLRALDLLIKVNKNRLRIENVLPRLVNALIWRTPHFLKRFSLVERTANILARHFPRRRFFIEYTFHTLALHNKFGVVRANELSGVVWHKEWDVSEMNLETLYHPIKDVKLHSQYRKILRREDA